MRNLPGTGPACNQRVPSSACLFDQKPEAIGRKLTSSCWRHRKQTADQLFEHLLTTLVTMVDAGESETLDEIEGFFSATSHLIFVKDTGAAAAA